MRIKKKKNKRSILIKPHDAMGCLTKNTTNLDLIEVEERKKT